MVRNGHKTKGDATVLPPKQLKGGQVQQGAKYYHHQKIEREIAQ